MQQHFQRDKIEINIFDTLIKVLIDDEATYTITQDVN